MSLPNKIFLIGFMGSGKSTLAKKLANKLSVPFLDLDSAIEKQEGKTISQLFELKGEEYFRKIEKAVLKDLTQSNTAFVMALGGGTPCFHQNIGFINANGCSIYLKYNAGILFSRLVNAKTDRPLIANKTDEELKLFIEEKLKERETYYNQSKYIVESQNLTVEEILELIL